jgi:PAS domain S-box-containing protein
MKYEDKSKKELIKELMESKRDTDLLKASYERDISERSKGDEALKKSEEKFRKAFITSPDSININRLCDGMFISINSGFSKIMGYTEADVIGKTSIELNIWKDPEDRKKLVDGLSSKEVVENIEASFVAKDGSIKYGMMSAALIDLEGVPHILNITRDITDRKYAEMALLESENRYRELIELAVDGILLGASDGIIIGANSVILHLTGRPLEKLLGINISELFDPEELKTRSLRFDLLQKGETVINERNIFRPDGKKIPVEMHTKMMPDGSYQSIFHDITDRKMAEIALRESEEWFRNLFEQSSDGIFYLSETGKIIAVNKSFAEMHGYTIDEILKMNVRDLDSPESNELFSERLLKIQGGESLKFEVEHFHRDGHMIPLEVTTGMISLGSENYIIASHRDISERIKADVVMKLAMEKAEASDRLKTSFLNNISHEVRTPLNGILGFAEIISLSDLTDEEKKVAFSMVHESSNRLLETITNYMDISLLVSGEMTVNMKKFKPVPLLRDIFSKFRSVCNSKNIDFSLSIPENSENLFISSDTDHLQKIITQLLNNAVKFTKMGQIQFGFETRKENLEFFISDTGIGIGKDSLDDVFNHFVKEDQIKARPTEGSGLGLSISKGLVELLGGSIWVNSEVGKGSEFFFTIPHKILPGIDKKESAESCCKKTPKLKSILVAEDDEYNYIYLKTLLDQATSATIIHAANGREAIDKFRDNPGIELVLMDIKMPEMDGLEATRKIKSINPAIPVIAITAYAMLGDESRILEAGCDGYLSKPISRKSLLEKMSEYVNI